MDYRIILPLLILAGSIISCKDHQQTKKPAQPSTGYTFDIPKGWHSERIPFPIEFAPQIPYRGFEDLRFPPGWEFTTSDEHWSYTFLWWLDGAVQLDTAVLKGYLDNYYSGLLAQNVKKRLAAAKEIIHPNATITKAATANGDAETFAGTIAMPDYLDVTFPTLTLNCVIHQKDCGTHTAVIFEVSPQPAGHRVWQQLNQLEEGFKCNAAD